MLNRASGSSTHRARTATWPACAVLCRVDCVEWGIIKGQNGHLPSSLRVCLPAAGRPSKGRACNPPSLVAAQTWSFGSLGGVVVAGMTGDSMTKDVQPASQIARCHAGSRAGMVSLQRHPRIYRSASSWPQQQYVCQPPGKETRRVSLSVRERSLLRLGCAHAPSGRPTAISGRRRYMWARAAGSQQWWWWMTEWVRVWMRVWMRVWAWEWVCVCVAKLSIPESPARQRHQCLD